MEPDSIVFCFTATPPILGSLNGASMFSLIFDPQITSLSTNATILLSDLRIPSTNADLLPGLEVTINFAQDLSSANFLNAAIQGISLSSITAINSLGAFFAHDSRALMNKIGSSS